MHACACISMLVYWHFDTWPHIKFCKEEANLFRLSIIMYPKVKHSSHILHFLWRYEDETKSFIEMRLLHDLQGFYIMSFTIQQRHSFRYCAALLYFLHKNMYIYHTIHAIIVGVRNNEIGWFIMITSESQKLKTYYVPKTEYTEVVTKMQG